MKENKTKYFRLDVNMEGINRLYSLVHQDAEANYDSLNEDLLKVLRFIIDENK